MSDVQAKLDYADAIADWFLGMGHGCSLRGDFEEGLKYTYVAANILYRQNRNLTSVRLESNLRFIASYVAEHLSPPVNIPPPTDQKEACLHVLSEALPAGGLTAMALRWIRNDRGRVHNVALLSQEIPIPDALLQAVRDTGGCIYSGNPSESFLNQAVWLKNLANSLADYVILHIGVSDVICGVAFGTEGGAPVLLVNHAAHIFWTGASVTDLVLNCRGSALEAFWTATYRGISRYSTVPIPLPEPDPAASGTSRGPELKCQAKQTLGIPTDSVAILTVGSSFKYLPTDGLDFVAVCESILKQLPQAYLLVVGFAPDSRWKKASMRSSSRIRVLGTVPQPQLALIHEAADIYIEGFPFGTTTSLLEAGLKGIPAVLAPAQCPPPYGSDGVALDDTLDRPRTLEEYKAKVVQLGRNPSERTCQGDQIRKAVIQHHTGQGWWQYLEDAIRTLPHEHSIHPSITPVRTPEFSHEYWAAFLPKWSSGYEETLEHALERAFTLGLRPQFTDELRRICKRYNAVRVHRTIPLPLLVFLCNYVIPALSIALAGKIFRLISFLCRDCLGARVRKRVIRLLGGKEGFGAYEEYRY
jgi:hypothetical protein